MPENVKPYSISKVAEQKMVREHFELRSSQIPILKMESWWILQDPRDGFLRLLEKPIRQFRPAF